jgi:rubrerythrin
VRSQAAQLEVLGLMAAHESAACDLYRTLAARFPERAELFLGLAEEEVEHARKIGGFAEQVRAGEIKVDPERFPPAAVLESLDRLRERAAQLERGDLSLADALAVAVDMENEILERSYFDVVESDGPELAELLRTLDAETRAHRERLGAAWEQERGRWDRRPQS